MQRKRMADQLAAILEADLQYANSQVAPAKICLAPRRLLRTMALLGGPKNQLATVEERLAYVKRERDRLFAELQAGGRRVDSGASATAASPLEAWSGGSPGQRAQRPAHLSPTMQPWPMSSAGETGRLHGSQPTRPPLALSSTRLHCT